MNDDDRQAHLIVYREMVVHYLHIGEPAKADKYLGMIDVVENCLSDATTTIRVDGRPLRWKDIERYCKTSAVRRTKKKPART